MKINKFKKNEKKNYKYLLNYITHQKSKFKNTHEQKNPKKKTPKQLQKKSKTTPKKIK